MNVQPLALQQFNLDELPAGAPPPLGAADEGSCAQAVAAIRHAERIVVRVGGGATGAGPEIQELLDLVDGVAVVAPIALGTLPHRHPRNMTVGGSKGSLSGNYAMEHADLLIAIGSRAVCQADCSRTGYPDVQHVININTDLHAAMHYGKTTALIGDAAPTIQRLIAALREGGIQPPAEPSPWMQACAEKRAEWDQFRAARYRQHTLYDEVWGREVLTQPAAIKAATDWVQANGAVGIFDAGDVQANGFQIIEPERLGQFYSEAGASYMGFGVSALLTTGIANPPFYGVAFTGDGSFTMNPQILIDGVQHGARGCILLFDNRRMAAISGLQSAQYGHDFATSDSVAVDYVAWASAIAGVNALHSGYSIETLLHALNQARQHPGLSLIHIPVYYGPDELGGMGVFGRWNVGNWSADTQALRHQIGL
jgi:3D-(3,5/4)-trihydroxycyclohexane-1,2-dione acylhydrolase (decyclizing)